MLIGSKFTADVNDRRFTWSRWITVITLSRCKPLPRSDSLAHNIDGLRTLMYYLRVFYYPSYLYTLHITFQENYQNSILYIKFIQVMER